MHTTAFCQNTTDSLQRNDSTEYCFNENQVKAFIKTAIDLKYCDSANYLLLEKNRLQLSKNKELQDQVNYWTELSKLEKKKSNKLKWAIGGTSVIVGGFIIYAIIRK